MALRRFNLAPLAVVLYNAPYRMEEFPQLRDRCATDLPGLVAEFTVLSTTPGIQRLIPGTVDTPRLDACISTAATVISAVNRANRAAASGSPYRPGVQAQSGS